MCRRWLLVYILPLSVGINALLLKSFWIALLRAEYGTKLQIWSTTYTTLVNLSTVLVSPIIGKISDRFGRKFPMVLVVLSTLVQPLLYNSYKSFSITVLYILGFIANGIYSCVALLTQSYVIDQTDNDLKYIGLIYIFLAFGFVLAAGLSAGLTKNLAGVGIKLQNGDIGRAEYEQVLDDFIGPVAIGLVAFSIVLLLIVITLPATKALQKNREPSMGFLKSISYLYNAGPNVRKLALINMCRAALFLPPTANSIEYLQYRFSDQRPQFYVWILLNALMPCFSLAVIGRLAKKFGKKTLLLVGLAGYSGIDCLYAFVQESFYYALGIASIFYAMALISNPILDQYAAAEAGEDAKGQVLGAMAQARSFVSFCFTIPSGFLFSRAEELVLNSGNPSGYRWLSGMPFLPFALFGVGGWAIVLSARFINNKQEEVDSSTDEYTKLEEDDNTNYSDENAELEFIGRSESLGSLGGDRLFPQ